MKRLTASALAALLFVGVTACGDDDDDNGAGGSGGSGDESSQELIVGIGREPTTLDPMATDDNSRDFVMWRVTEGLVDFDHDGNLVPQLAAELPVQDTADPTVWSVELRDDVEFSNGEKLDAEAVVANVERTLDPDFASTYTGAELSTLASARAVDDTTVEFVTTQPDPIFDFKLRSLRLVPPVYGADWEESAALPIGTGPFEVVEWNRGSSITLTANESYRDDAPAITDIEIRFIPDEGTRIQSLQAGEIHMAADISPDLADDVPQLIVPDQGVQVGIVRIDPTKEPYSDVRFRQALNYALDKEALSEQLYNGLFEPAACQLTPIQAVGSNKSLEPYPYDLDRAKELIAEAGATGAEINVDWTSSIFAKDREYGEAVASMWREAGLDVQMTFNEGSTFGPKIYEKGPATPEMIYTEPDTPFNHAVRVAGFLYHRDGAASGNVGEVDPEFQSLLDEAFVELDETARNALYDELQARQCEQAAWVYLLVRKDTYGAVADLNYEPRPALFAKFYFDEVTFD